MSELRPYQREAVDAIYDYFSKNTGNPLIVMPTGTGKSITIAAFIKEAIENWNDSRIILLTHVRELIAQDYGALMRWWADAPAGIYSAGLGKKDLHKQIIFAGIQSIYKKAYEVQRCDLAIIDESHLLSESDNGMYRIFINQLREINPYLKVLGFTATPYRLKSGMLHEGEDSIFTDIAYNISILKMIEQGYLCPVIPKPTDTIYDLSGVGTRAGEFNAGQLERAVDTEDLNESVVREIVTLGQDRKSWLLFCSGVDHAAHIRDLIRDAGISSEMVTGTTPLGERDRIIRRFKSGELRSVTSVGALTTGLDVPRLDLIGMLRPTKSTSLYVQMLGRGTRLFEGKTDCLVLDFAGNIAHHGPLDMVDGRVKKKVGEGDAPNKKCPECDAKNPASARVCVECGFEFPPPKLNIEEEASQKALLSTQIQPEWLRISNVIYARHQKADKPPTLRVDYQCGLARQSEWISIEGSGFPRQKACMWWNKRAPGQAVPMTVAEAMARTGELATPTEIQVKQSGKYTEIVNARFG